MKDYQDFGFNSDEFLGEITTIPYCQFLNASSQNYGIAITSANAEIARFKSAENWQEIEHEFTDGTKDSLLVIKQPRLLILNRSQPLMSNEIERTSQGARTNPASSTTTMGQGNLAPQSSIIPYSKVKFSEGGYKAFSYVVVWFLDQNNQPLSELPFRLKCSGYAGLTFLKNYSYYNNAQSFCRQFLQVYKTLTGDRAIDKNEIFYAHAVYQPKLTRQKVTSSINGQSSLAVMTDGFVEPKVNNFGSLIIKNGSTVSNKIKELIVSSKSWLKTEALQHGLHLDEETSPSSPPEADFASSAATSEISEQNGISAGLTPEPIAF